MHLPQARPTEPTVTTAQLKCKSYTVPNMVQHLHPDKQEVNRGLHAAGVLCSLGWAVISSFGGLGAQHVVTREAVVLSGTHHLSLSVPFAGHLYSPGCSSSFPLLEMKAAEHI